MGSSGNLNAKLTWTYLHSYKRTFVDGTTVQYAGTHGPMTVSGNSGTPTNKANLEVTWEHGPASLSTYVTYIGNYLNTDNREAGCFDHLANGDPAPGDCRVSSFTTVDLHGSYKFQKNTELYLSIINLFDRIAPLDPSSYINLNFNPSFHLDGAIGRTFNIGLKHAF
jgi:iron complex outermembrane receptor protein